MRVKELHPDAGFDDPAASDQLKAVNLAYQTVKALVQGETGRRPQRGTFGCVRATFVIFLFLPVVAVALIMATEVYFGSSSVATDEVATAIQDEQKVGSSEPTAGLGQARDTDEKRLIAKPAGKPDDLDRLGNAARDHSGDAVDTHSTSRPADDTRDLAILETGAVSDRAEPKRTEEAPLEDVDTQSSGTVELGVHRVLPPLLAAGREQGEDDTAWFDAQRADTKEAFTAYLALRPNGRHAQTARTRISELDSVKETKLVSAAAVKTYKQRPRAGRPNASVAHSGYRRPSADEPFVGADGRLR
jgi:hypothetical protein